MAARAGQTAADEVIAAALTLARGGRWRLAAGLLDGVSTDDAPVRARVALAAAQVALDSDWFGGTALTAFLAGEDPTGPPPEATR